MTATSKKIPAATAAPAPQSPPPLASVAAGPAKKPAPAPAPAAPAEKAAPQKVGWRQQLTLSGMLLWTVVSTILVASGVVGTYAVYALYDNKLKDTWAILFLELEQQGNWILKRLDRFVALHSDPAKLAAAGQNHGDVVLAVTDKGFRTIRGEFPNELRYSDLNLKGAEMGTRWTVLQYGGHEYLAFQANPAWLSARYDEPFPNGRYFVLWPIDIRNWLESAHGDDEKNVVYLVTREGRLLFANRDEITPARYMNRPLVQKFVSNPLRQGQVEFEDEEGAKYGFFYEVPDTNLLIFVETSKKVALAQVREISFRYGLLVLFILMVAGVFLQFPLSMLVVAPMRELVRVANEVGDGNFDVWPRRRGLGELAVLSQAFTDMAKNLVIRDKKIQALLVEQQERMRLKNELAIATSIQERFLIQNSLPKEAGIEIAAQYTPATDVGGDWYGYFYNQSHEQSIFVVADVSGHGAGSAMFTAIIAAHFEEWRETVMRLGKVFQLEEYAMRLNRLIRKLGHGGIHATVLVASYRKGSGVLDIVNAGHPPPMLFPADPAERGYPVMIRADALGLSDEYKPAISSVEFPAGTSLLMFTDGLIEGRPDHKVYSERRLNKAARLKPGVNINQMVIRVFEDWRKYLGGEQALDDVCLLAIRATA